MSHAIFQPATVCALEIHQAEELWREDASAMAEAIATLIDAVDRVLDAHGGRAIDAAEAEFVVRFDEVTDAVEWGLALLEELGELDWADSLLSKLNSLSKSDLLSTAAMAGLQVSVGVDTGALDTRTSTRTGQRLAIGEPIRAAAKLARSAPAGAVALSPVARDLLDDGITQAAADLSARVRDHTSPPIIVPERLEDVVETDTATSSERWENLPDFSGMFIDRVREFRALADAIDREHSYVAICGSAGAGKSRLAVEFARRWLAFHRRQTSDQEPGAQAWFCDLAEVDALDEALFSLARITGVQIPPSETVEAMEQALVRAFRGRGPVLLVLDDVDPVGRELDESVARWFDQIGLDGAANVQVIATRQRLPEADVEVVNVSALGHASATALLEDRLRHPMGSAYQSEDPAKLAGVVAKSGRLPLALELLAGTVGHETNGTLGEEDSGVGASNVTSTGELDEAMRRSWKLLTEREQTALMACTVFSGNFTEQAAAAVVDLPQAPEVLAALRQYSLLRTDGRSQSSARLILLAPVREFVAARADKVVIDAARRAHLAYFASWATELKDALRSDREHAWLRRAEHELANLYRAADYGPKVDLNACLTILEGLGELDTRIGPLGGFKERADVAVEAAQQVDNPALNLRALRLRGERLLWTGQYDEAAADYAQAHELAEELVDSGDSRAGGDTRMAVASTLCNEGFARGMRGEEEEALTKVRQAAEMVRDLDHFDAISVLNSAAVIARNRNKIDEALDYHHRALVRARRIDNTYTQASALFFLGSTLRRDQQWQEAIRSLEESGDLFSTLGDRRGQLVSYHELAECYLATDQIDSAERCYLEAMDLASDIGDREYSSTFFLGRGRSRFGRGEYARAEDDLLEASIAVDEVGHIHLKIAVKLYLAATYAALDRVAEARTYFERVEKLFEDTDVTRARPVYEVLYGYLDAARAHTFFRDGDKEQALELLASAYERAALDTGGDKPSARESLREAKRLETYLDKRVEAGELPAGADASRKVIQVGEDMRWFAVDDDEPVDISRRGAIRRILRALIEKRLEEPDTPMDVHELLEAGWPDEATVGESGQQRTYMAISRLRGLGLSDVLETVDEGYLISTAYTPVWVEKE